MNKKIDESTMTNQERRHFRNKVFRLFDSGYSCKKISKAVPVKLQTIIDWITHAAPFPLNHPKSSNTKGRKPKLDLKKLSPQLCRAFNKLPNTENKDYFWTYKSLQLFLSDYLKQPLTIYQVKQILPYYFNLPKIDEIQKVFSDKYPYEDGYISYSPRSQQRWYYLRKTHNSLALFSPRGDMKLKPYRLENNDKMSDLIKHLILSVKNTVVIIFSPFNLPLTDEIIKELEYDHQVLFLKYDEIPIRSFT